MKPSTKRVLATAAGGGVVGALTAIGAPIGILSGLVLGAVFEVARKGKALGDSVGDDGTQGVATIEEARFGKSALAQTIFARPDVPWWLVGVGIGGAQSNYYVTVAVESGAPPAEIRQWIPRASQGVPVVVDASGAQPLEMRAS